MATVTKTIGTSSRDYSDINAWEADLNSDSIYSNGDTAIGEIYADSTFTDVYNLIENGSAIGGSSGYDLALIKLTVHADSRHDGTAGSGALLKPTAAGTHNNGVIRVNVDNVTIEWLEIDMDNDDDFTNADNRAVNKAIVLTGTNNNCIIRNMLIHGKRGNPGGTGPYGIHMLGAGASSDSIYILNNIVYNLVETSNDTASAINTHLWAGNAYIYNNTVYNIQGQGGSKHGLGFRFGNPSSSNTRIKNNIASKCEGDNNRAYWKNSSGSTVDSANNLSDDTTDAAYNAEDMSKNLDDSSALVGKTAAQIDFVSITTDSEDLHLDVDSVCRKAGVDLGTTNGVNIDIDGLDRDATGVTWDIGADQASTADTGSPAFLMFVD